MDWVARQNKRLSREYVLEGYQQKGAAIFLPGWDEFRRQAGQDVRLALQQGKITLDQPLYVVEFDAEIAPKIFADLRKMGFTNLITHQGDLSTLKLEHDIDFAFIDLMGTLNRRVCEWMEGTLAPRLMADATVALTVSFGHRSNPFMKDVAEIYREQYPDVVSEAREHYKIQGHHRLVPVLLMRSIFRHHVFAYRKLLKYQDNVMSMLTYKLNGFRRDVVGNGSPPLAKVMDALPERVRAVNAPALQTLSTRQQAAHKAWETRRKNGWVHPKQRAA